MNIIAKNRALKIQSAQRAMNESETQEMVNRILNVSIKEKIWECNLCDKDICKIFQQYKCTFWYSVLMNWSMENYDFVTAKPNILHQMLWFNSDIRIAGQTACFQRWMKNGILYVNDIWYLPSNRLYDHDELQHKYRINIPFTEYYSLCAAIPRMWLACLTENTELPAQQDQTNNKRIETLSILYKRIMFNDTLIYNQWCKWQKQFSELEYEEFIRYISYITTATISTKLRSFQYRLCMCAIITNIHLKHYGLRADNLCSFCNKHPEDVKHLFYDCEQVKLVWNKICDILRITSINYQQVIFNNIVQRPKAIENCIVLITKFYLYK